MERGGHFFFFFFLDMGHSKIYAVVWSIFLCGIQDSQRPHIEVLPGPRALRAQKAGKEQIISSVLESDQRREEGPPPTLAAPVVASACSSALGSRRAVDPSREVWGGLYLADTSRLQGPSSYFCVCFGTSAGPSPDVSDVR